MQLDMQTINSKFILNQILAFTGIAALSSITFPLQMIRTRLQTIPQLLKQKRINTPYLGVKDCIKRVSREQGYKAFWKGNFANVMRLLPNQTFNFFTKQSIQLWAKRQNLATDNDPSLNFLSGSIGAIFTLAFIYPMDYARARLTNDILGESSIRSVLVNTYKKQGLAGIYRGSINFFISASIFRAFYFGIFDTIKKLDPTKFHYKIFGSYFGSLIAIYLVYPFDTIRKIMMMTSGQSYKYKGFIDCAGHMLKKQGFRSFYKGWQLSLGQGMGAAGSLIIFDKIGTDVKKINNL